MNLFRVRSDHDTTILGLSDVVIQCLGHHIEWQSPLSQPLDEFQAGHLFLPLCADLSVRFAARAIWHCLVLDIGGRSDPLYLTTLSTRRLLFQSVPPARSDLFCLSVRSVIR
jgi:hypothetical protein